MLLHPFLLLFRKRLIATAMLSPQAQSFRVARPDRARYENRYFHGRTNRARRGNTKWPAASSMTLIWQV